MVHYGFVGYIFNSLVTLFLELYICTVWPCTMSILYALKPIFIRTSLIGYGMMGWSDGGGSAVGHTHVSVQLMAHRKVRLAAGRANVCTWNRSHSMDSDPDLDPNPYPYPYPYPNPYPDPDSKFCSFSERIYARTPSGTCDYLCRCWLWSWWPLGSIGRQFYVISQSSGFSGGLWEHKWVVWNGMELNGSTCALVCRTVLNKRSLCYANWLIIALKFLHSMHVLGEDFPLVNGLF